MKTKLALLLVVMAACNQQVVPVAQQGRRIEVACDVPVGDYVYAELEVPGASAQQLEEVKAVGFIEHPPTDLWADYDRTNVALVLMRDGGVAALCGGAGGLLYDRVAFILPAELAQ